MLTFDEWVLQSAAVAAMVEASGSRGHVESLLRMMLPIMPLQGLLPGWLALAPDTPQVRRGLVGVGVWVWPCVGAGPGRAG